MPDTTTDAATDLATGWITLGTQPSPSPANTWLCFRHRFRLGERPVAARVRVACDSRYWLWVNGVAVVRDGQLKAGPTPTSSYADTVELGEHLVAGENTMAVLVWHFGRPGFSHRSSGRAALLVDGFGPCATGAVWRVRAHRAYGTCAGDGPNFRLPEPSVRVDGREELGDWFAPDADDTDAAGWSAATVCGAAGDPPWGELHERPIPPWRVSGVLPFVDPPALPWVSDGSAMELRMPYNAQASLVLDFEAPGDHAGGVVDARTDAYAVHGEGTPIHRAEYVLREGAQRYAMREWINGHAWRVTVPEGVTVTGAGYVASAYDVDPTPGFRCDDAAVNTLCEKSLRTLLVCMRDTYMDCPCRERAQWWGDVVIQIAQAYYALDRRADALAAKGIRELASWRRENGAVFSPVPADNWDKELPLQMLASVGRYGFWQHYLHTGDRDTLAAAFPAARRYVLEVWAMAGDGLVTPRLDGAPDRWVWTDWGRDQDHRALTQCWYALALEGLALQADALGDTGTAGEARARWASIHERFHDAYWTGDAYRSPEHGGATDDRANAMAVNAGLAPAGVHDAVVGVLTSEYHASPYMERYVLDALYRMGRADEAVARLLRADRFGAMVDSPSSTLWEVFPAGGSYNHAWSGAPLLCMCDRAMGLRPTAPAYAAFEWTPQPGPLGAMTLGMETARGPIDAAYRRDGGRVVMTIEHPAGTTATVRPPVVDGAGERVTVNGEARVRDAEGCVRLAGGGPWTIDVGP